MVAAAAGCGGATAQPSVAPQPAAAAATATTAPASPASSLAATPSPTVTPAATTSPSATAAPSAFHATVRPLDAATRRSMIDAGTWRPGCPVSLDELRLVTVSYWGFDDRPHTGRLVLNRDATRAVISALRSLYRARFPIRRMQLVDRYDADDERSMAADNTSAYNGRKVPGTDVWSQHAYGRAIDINPLENPAIEDGEVDPPQAAQYVDRSQRVKGMIHGDDVVVRAFARVGWPWGGHWHSLKDYQHFSASGY
jgi:hypothetical protein